MAAGTSSSDTSYLPNCWNDDERMSSLMSMFKKRDVNPVDYDSKIKFWSELITTSCQHFKRPSFTLKDLNGRFKRKDRIPSCLEVVVRDMLVKGEIVTKDAFLSDKGWLSWGMNTFVKRPLSWLFGGAESEPDLLQTEFVVPSVVKDIAHKVVELRRDAHEVSGGHNVIEWRKFLKEMSPFGFSEQTLVLATAYLQKSNIVTIGQSHSGDKLLKFEMETTAGPIAITEQERNLHKVQNVIETLESDLAGLDTKIAECDEQARFEIRRKNKIQAKQHLRKKLQLTKKLQEKEAALEKLTHLRDQLAQTKDQKRILDAYKAGVEAFKADFKNKGLDVDRIDDTMDEIEEVLQNTRDMNEALARSPTSPVASDAELEAELTDLLKQKDEEEIEFPKVPTSTPEFPKVPTSTPIHISPFEQTEDRLKKLRRDLENADLS